MYKDNQEALLDEVVTIFFGGMKTIQMATANLITYLTRDVNIKNRLLQDIDAIFKNLDVSKNYSDYDLDLLYDRNFDYLEQCFNESMRIEPPIPISTSNMFATDVKIGNSVIKAG
mmetsp:Transcript_30091/g.40749  ORF Transcript_30091/g.40749 Transcript_30091/m.40749 type:complete len:115 (-) Transcript_30091:400-744(-)|eukprot:CAMPEP_0176345202 /NCGR_PEP_ID=MMETSP0126-20121128/5272_1 /TAXON_ID=141414 ORGANISM="Strombidinopsis acuminatum, Strain SPMC142" /NCGR_SAMPLE_ID=MMETSP0126 /ASSEMBLY_ACC=CAM_ASM_000229 /LENGTH=114 /DNA_ID=CAMNT_0017692043 /DNA_START=895 /DNA_END=1239 /DNA_ORIENTATION=-